MGKVCALTGHRKLTGELDEALLQNVLEDLIKGGCDCFLCGMAVGFDMVAAEKIIALKSKYPVKLTACLPYRDQSEIFRRESKDRYDKILQNCDEVEVLSEIYTAGCMHYRDRYMVENSDVVLCFLRQKKGGTYYTVNYARKIGKKVIEL